VPKLDEDISEMAKLNNECCNYYNVVVAVSVVVVSVDVNLSQLSYVSTTQWACAIHLNNTNKYNRSISQKLDSTRMIQVLQYLLLEW